jgi:hypothetical protein
MQASFVEPPTSEITVYWATVAARQWPAPRERIRRFDS